MKTIKYFRNARPIYSRWPGTLMVITGILLILIAPIIVWLFREEFANLNPRSLLNMWYGAGGFLLLYLTAGLPLGAILVAAGGAHLYPSTTRARRILFPLLGIQIVYFTFHAIRLMIDLKIPFLLFAIMGFIFIFLFLTIVGIWARKRPGLKPQRQRVIDLQLGAALCFFSAAWQSCGLLGAPGFAMHPEIVQKLGNQSFIAGQALATHIFFIFGFVFLLLSVRTEPAKNQDNGEHLDGHDQAT